METTGQPGQSATPSTPKPPPQRLNTALPPRTVDRGLARVPLGEWLPTARWLIDRVQGLPSVPEAATILLAAAVRTAPGADGACLLREADGLWQVVAGAGLRPLEHHLIVPGDHWLMVAGIDSGPVLHVPDTDHVRAHLVGAPLASRKTLLRLLATTGDVAVVLGWSATPLLLNVQPLVSAVERQLPGLQESQAVRSLALSLQGWL